MVGKLQRNGLEREVKHVPVEEHLKAVGRRSGYKVRDTPDFAMPRNFLPSSGEQNGFAALLLQNVLKRVDRLPNRVLNCSWLLCGKHLVEPQTGGFDQGRLATCFSVLGNLPKLIWISTAGDKLNHFCDLIIH